MLNRSEQFTSYENDIRFTSDENDMISGNARQIKECKTDLSPEGSSSSGSIDSNIKGKRNFMLHSTKTASNNPVCGAGGSVACERP